jgi:organic radical activating enzyme
VSRRQPTVEWQVCGLCNYSCSYCIQSPKHRTGHPDAEQLEGFLSFFRGLRGVWEIKMTGGEPFAFEGFMGRIVPGLLERTPHRLSVLTNLSAPRPVLRRFAEATGPRLGIVSASLHLEHTSPERFVERALELREAIAPSARLVVNAVLVPGRLAVLREARELVLAAGLRFFPQLMKVKRAPGGVASYPEEERDLLRSLLGDDPTPRQANLAPDYRGRGCWAGAEYFVLTQKGEAWSCRAARRAGEGYLGQVLEGSVALRFGPAPCSYPLCPCTTPANRGMIEGLGEQEAR